MELEEAYHIQENTVIPKQRNNLHLDLNLVKREYKNFSVTGSRGKFIIEGFLRPTEASPDYHIRISVCQDRKPKITVLSPAINPKSKHLYNDGSLCVYKPDAISTSTPFFYRDFLIPWIALWLFFYEKWLITRIWFGPEYIHTGRKS